MALVAIVGLFGAGIYEVITVFAPGLLRGDLDQRILRMAGVFIWLMVSAFSRGKLRQLWTPCES
jgi:hypothetical protein